MDFKRVKDYLSWLYYQYQIISCCAVLEPWEQSMFNTIILTIFAMVVYTAYVLSQSTFAWLGNFSPKCVAITVQFLIDLFCILQTGIAYVYAASNALI